MPTKHRTHGNFGDKSTFKRISNDYYNCAVDSSNNIVLDGSGQIQTTWINYKIALLYDKHNMDALQATKDMCASYYQSDMSNSLCGWDCIAKTRFLYKNGDIKTINPAWAG
tara:strand:+ start:55 stop:387 length:333 start_codon:yes stop_codon:yes gene_type:complete